jgi:hypothetical protein
MTREASVARAAFRVRRGVFGQEADHDGQAGQDRCAAHPEAGGLLRPRCDEEAKRQRSGDRLGQGRDDAADQRTKAVVALPSRRTMAARTSHARLLSTASHQGPASRRGAPRVPGRPLPLHGAAASTAISSRRLLVVMSR